MAFSPSFLSLPRLQCTSRHDANALFSSKVTNSHVSRQAAICDPCLETRTMRVVMCIGCSDCQTGIACLQHTAVTKLSLGLYEAHIRLAICETKCRLGPVK